MNDEAQQRVALITGSARGLGRAIAEALAGQGVTLMLVDILADRLEQTKGELEAGGARCAAFPTDIASRANCIAAVEAAIATFGRLDILINAAGLMRFNHAVDVPEDEFSRIMQVNAAAPFWLAQAAIPHLLETKGNIVNILSQSALMGASYIVPYSMSKAALLQLTKSLAAEYMDKPIRINAVAPGSMLTDIAAEAPRPDDVNFAKIMRYAGDRPIADPAEVAAVVAFLVIARSQCCPRGGLDRRRRRDGGLIAAKGDPMTLKQKLGRVGIWSMELRFGDPGEAADAVAELDELGFGSIWVPGGIGGPVLSDIGRLLAASRKAVIATGILNIWKHEPKEVGDWWKAQSTEQHARTLLGLGVSHGPLIGEAYSKPLAAMRNYLDQLAAEGVPSSALCLAALGPKMLELSRDRTAGAHPYLVTPEHSAQARKILGPDALLAPEQGVIFESDPSRARELARQALTHYLTLPNYANNWRRLGLSEADIAEGSDHLVDALFAWGGPEQIADRVNAHLAAGADHVCVQVVTGAGLDLSVARSSWRALAAALL